MDSLFLRPANIRQIIADVEASVHAMTGDNFKFQPDPDFTKTLRDVAREQWLRVDGPDQERELGDVNRLAVTRTVARLVEPLDNSVSSNGTWYNDTHRSKPSQRTMEDEMVRSEAAVLLAPTKYVQQRIDKLRKLSRALQEEAAADPLFRAVQPRHIYTLRELD